MNLLARYLMREILGSIVLVFTALLTLFSFFDMIHELDRLGRGDYTLGRMFVYVALSVPGHIYELFPIAALIGAMFALARLVSSSEFVMLRVSGLSALRIALYLVTLGLMFSVVMFVFGEYIAPTADRIASSVRLKATGKVIAQGFRSGLWIKDGTRFVNIREMLPDNSLREIKIYEFDEAFRLGNIRYAGRATYNSSSVWTLQDIVQTEFNESGASISNLSSHEWRSALTPDLIKALLVPPEQMAVQTLYPYIQHLQKNRQKTSRYEIALWGKLTYPLAVPVMLLLALPFAYLHSRTGQISARVFSGIMLGLAFHLLNRLFAHLGLLNDWPPLLSVTLPTLVFLVLAIILLHRFGAIKLALPIRLPPVGHQYQPGAG
jgi:lipopolysaccharide export system permease protein